MWWLSRSALLFCSLLLAELSLRILGLAIPQVHALTGPRREMTRVIPHPVLGVVGNPEFLEHDDRGFRNAATVHRARIVTLGDSNTYGTGVEVGHAWPAVLAWELGVSVYNMGLGGYGAAHNAENLATALDLSPDLVIFALYFGNDFYDDFRFALKTDRLATIISSQMAENAIKLEQESSLADDVQFLFRSGAATNEDRGTGGAHGGALGRKVLRWLPERIRLVGLVRALKIQLADRYESALLDRNFEKAKGSLGDRQRQFVSVFEGTKWTTLLTAPYRLRVMDDADPRIRSGIEVTTHMIRRMRDRVAEAGADYLVLLLPTKEYVFWPKVKRPTGHAQLGMLVATEERLGTELKDFLRAEGIRYVDPSPALRNSVKQPYFPNADGHPNQRGHQIIAWELLSNLGHR